VGVADITLSQAITQQLNQQEQSIANLEEQVSSGRSLNKPSDNPAAVELAGERPDGNVLAGYGK
jgi:flagellin-like hook-associated protein FlgL